MALNGRQTAEKRAAAKEKEERAKKDALLAQLPEDTDKLKA